MLVDCNPSVHCLRKTPIPRIQYKKCYIVMIKPSEPTEVLSYRFNNNMILDSNEAERIIQTLVELASINSFSQAE